MAVDTDLLQALGVGSGVDIKKLATTLTEAARAPKKEQIEAKIETAESKISGYGGLMFGLSELNTAFKDLNDKTDFQSLTTSSSNSSAVTTDVTSSAVTGKHYVEISQLAKAQRNSTAGFAATSTTLNSGNAFNLAIVKGGVTTNLQLADTAQITTSGTFASNSTSINSGNAFNVNVTVGGTTTAVNVASGSTTPSGVVTAINNASLGITATWDSSNNKIQLTGTGGSTNSFTVTVTDASSGNAVSDLTLNTNTQTATSGNASATPAGIVSAVNNANIGITASLIDTGASSNPYKVVLTGTTGSSNSFTATITDKSSGSAISGLNFSTSLQSAQDSSFTVDGLAITRSTNKITDVVTGVTFNLYAATSSAATIDITRDTSAVQTKVKNLVSTFNDFSDLFDVMGNPDSQDPDFGGALVGDSLLRSIKSQVINMVTKTSSTPGTTSSTTGITVSNLSDIGISINRYGKLELNETTFQSAFSDETSFENMRKMFTADTDYQSEYSTSSAGLAGDALVTIKSLTDSNGIIQTKRAGQQTDVADFEDDLKELESRLEKVYDRYIKQFSAMDAIVTQMNATRDSIKQQFEYKANNN